MDIKKLNLNSMGFWKNVDKLTKDMETNPDLRKAFESNMISVMRKYQLDMDIPVSEDGKKTDKLLNLLEKNPDAQKTMRSSLIPANLRSREDAQQISRLADVEKSAKDFMTKLKALQADMTKDSVLRTRFQNDMVAVFMERDINMIMPDGRTSMVERLSQIKDPDEQRLVADVFKNPDLFANDPGTRGWALVVAVVAAAGAVVAVVVAG